MLVRIEDWGTVQSTEGPNILALALVAANVYSAPAYLPPNDIFELQRESGPSSQS